jgi:hypothetical protein
MKKLILLPVLLLAAAGYVYLQTTTEPSKLAAFMPGGAMLCLESPDFGRLLRDWDGSKAKSDWLASGNFAVFSRSNLFIKLSEVYNQYGQAAGFAPDLKSVIEIAGRDSALALYEIRDVEFLYISRMAETDIASTPLWAVRARFEQRQAGGTAFYVHSDPASKRTVAFAFAKGYLFLGTREDLVAQSLELLAGAGNPHVAAERWYRDAIAQAPRRGELRMVMNLESIVKSVYFRSYWVQRNASAVRRYWTGVADVTRSSGSIAENRVFLRTPEPGEPPAETIGGLPALVPPDAGMYKAAPISDLSAAASMIVGKLIGSPARRSYDWRAAPYAVSPDQHAGTESDLETRIDEQPLPADTGVSDSTSAIRTMLDRGRAHASLLIQSSSPVAGTFIQTPSVIVIAAAADWDHDLVRSSLASAAGRLWTTSQLGAAWTLTTVGSHPIERLDGLGTLAYAMRGPLLFLSNDPRMLSAVLDRVGTSAPAKPLTYAAGYRHLRERPNYERIMAALDFTSASANRGFYRQQNEDAPTFFSGNIGSLGRVFASVGAMQLTEEERGSATVQTVVYQIEP